MVWLEYLTRRSHVQPSFGVGTRDENTFIDIESQSHKLSFAQYILNGFMPFCPFDQIAKLYDLIIGKDLFSKTMQFLAFTG